MKGYVVCLFVALACSSKADDTISLKARLEETNRSVETIIKVMAENVIKRQREIHTKRDILKQIDEKQKDLLKDQLELVKVNVMLELRNLQLEQCLNPEKGKQPGFDKLVKERADQMEAEVERNAKEALKENYNKLLQLPAFQVIEVDDSRIYPK